MEGKKSFILYCDLIHSMSYLTNEEKGLVFSWVLDYVNDLNPEPLEGILQAVIEPIKQQLKRDLKKFEKIKENRSEAGKKGANKRWQNIAKDSKRIKSIAKIAVNDTVTVNDNVNDSDIKKEGLVYPFSSDVFKNHWKLWKEYKKTEFKFQYKHLASEQAALAELSNLSESEENSIAIINQSLANGWKGFFKLKKTDEKIKGVSSITNEGIISSIQNARAKQEQGKL